MILHNSLRQLWHYWKHEGGTQVLQCIAVLATIAALGGTMVAVANTQGIQVAQTVTDSFTGAINVGSGDAPHVAAEESSAAPLSAALSSAEQTTATGAAAAIPSAMQTEAEETAPERWSGLPDWLLGLFAGLLGALAAIFTFGLALGALALFGVSVSLVKFGIAAAITAGMGMMQGAVMGATNGITTPEQFFQTFLQTAILSLVSMPMSYASISALGGLGKIWKLHRVLKKHPSWRSSVSKEMVRAARAKHSKVFAEWQKATGWAKAAKILDAFKYPASVGTAMGIDAAYTGEVTGDKMSWGIALGIVSLPLGFVGAGATRFVHWAGRLATAGAYIGYDPIKNFVRPDIDGKPDPGAGGADPGAEGADPGAEGADPGAGG